MAKETAKEMMNRLYKEYNLSTDDVFSHKHYKIITRAGIDKIQSAANIVVDYEPVLINVSDSTYFSKKVVRGDQYDASLINKGDVNSIVLKATGKKFDNDGNLVATITSFGEAAPSNCDNAYMVAMAEKRGMARVVLKLAGLYEENFFSEDEADDFKKSVNEQRRARFKG